jgi:hypothetical protein
VDAAGSAASEGWERRVVGAPRQHQGKKIPFARAQKILLSTFLTDWIYLLSGDECSAVLLC